MSHQHFSLPPEIRNLYQICSWAVCESEYVCSCLCLLQLFIPKCMLLWEGFPCTDMLYRTSRHNWGSVYTGTQWHGCWVQAFLSACLHHITCSPGIYLTPHRLLHQQQKTFIMNGSYNYLSEELLRQNWVITIKCHCYKSTPSKFLRNSHLLFSQVIWNVPKKKYIFLCWHHLTGKGKLHTSHCNSPIICRGCASKL